MSSRRKRNAKSLSKTYSAVAVSQSSQGIRTRIHKQTKPVNGDQRLAVVQSCRTAALTDMYEDLQEKKKGDEVAMEAPGGLDADDAMCYDDETTAAMMDWADTQIRGERMEYKSIWNGVDGNSDESSDEWQDTSESEDEGPVTRIARRRLYRKAQGRLRARILDANWRSVYDDLFRSYLEFDKHGPPKSSMRAIDGDGEVTYHRSVLCINLFDQAEVTFEKDGIRSLAAIMVRHGYMPTTPNHPDKGIAINVLEVYRVISTRCARLGIETFVRALCELQLVPYNVQLRPHFSQAFDAYLEVLHRIDEKLDEILYPTTLAKYQDACPCCAYKLSNEEKLSRSLLFCMDGNESLKRHVRIRRKKQTDGDVIECDVERPEERMRSSYMFVEAEEVDRFRDEVRKGKMRMSDESPESDEASPVDGMDEKSPCSDRWTNLAVESKKKMWGTFHETGIFVAACRHGVVLLLCDMVKSGELAKYPLALVNRLISIFGEDMLGGYDIGCGFSTTANRSILVGPKMRAARCNLCCNSFHGHAHNRKCQLEWHPLYTDGAGLEDFEGCERIFSDSNNIARVIRHTSRFHHRQMILRHFERWNRDKYMNLTRFLINNYKQALRNIVDYSHELDKAMGAYGITSVEQFRTWRMEEFEYLRTLQNSAPVESDDMRMEYVSTLKDLNAAMIEFNKRVTNMMVLDADDYKNGTANRRHGQQGKGRKRLIETVTTLQTAARAYEERLNIEERWTPQSEGWKWAEMSEVECRYDRALDHLEGLVVACLFELAKMNRAETGYKLRRQVAKALKSRSKAVAAAVQTFNEAATVLGRRTLDLQDVLSYVFLGEFDLLRGSKSNIMEKPWAKSGVREASVLFYKLERSREEICHLDVELRRLSEYTAYIEGRMKGAVAELEARDDALAFQMQKRALFRSSISKQHNAQLAAVRSWAGSSSAASVTVTSPEPEISVVNQRIAQIGETEADMDEAEAQMENDAVALDDSLEILSRTEVDLVF